MSDSIKKQFRSTSGLDAANEKIINVAKADRNTPHDGVNVEYFTEENTIQQYDKDRGYPSNFAVIYDGRIWSSNKEIQAPAGDFVSEYWTAVRTDAKYQYINSDGKQLRSGDFISSDTSNTNLNYTLPSNPQDGDTIILQDVGGNVGVFSCTISVSNHRINFNRQQVTSFNITNPYTRVILIFSNKLWQTFVTSREEYLKQVYNTGGDYQSQAGEKIVARFSGDLPLNVKLPKYANSGDTIRIVDIDLKEPVNHINVFSYDDTMSVDSIGTKSKEYRLSGECQFIYDSTDKLWRFWTSDIRKRTKIIQDDITAEANSSIVAFGENNVSKTINIVLPTKPAIGDTVRIALNYLRPGQSVNIKCSDSDLIATNKIMTQFPHKSDYINDNDWFKVKELNYSGNDYSPILEFSYTEGITNLWVVNDLYPRIERVDYSNRDRLGVIALANQDQANQDKSNNPEKELAITPETLANRTATESRQGIASIATSFDVNKDSSDSYDDINIITPKKLNERTATESRRGLAEITTQEEIDKGVDDTTIVTPLKLDRHRANENMAGVLPIVRSGGVKSSVNDAPGTGVFDWNDNSKAVTPKALREIKSSETTQGTIFVATETQVIDAPKDIAEFPTAVTPEQLHKKTATEGRIGFTQTATQTDTNSGSDDFKYITPKKLNERKSTEKLDGIIRLSTQDEFNAGDSDNTAPAPSKIKKYFDSIDRVIVNQNDGLVQENTIWKGLHLTILNSSENQRGTTSLATQNETNAGDDDTKIVTPKKLHAKKATEEAEGIIRISNQGETSSGDMVNVAVSPRNLKYVIQDEKSWEASTTIRGPVKISENSITFIGNNVDGSTADLESYVKTGYAISPYELNKTLTNYLPLNATSANSDLLGGQLPSQYVRSDIDQNVNGNITFKGNLKLGGKLESESSGKFKSLLVDDSVVVGDNDGPSSIELNGFNNNWKLESGSDNETITLSSNDLTVLSAKNDGNVNFNQSILVNNTVNSGKGFILDNIPVIVKDESSLCIGSKTNTVSILSPDASVIKVIDNDGSYNIINNKNAVNELSNDFVRRNADSVITGQLTFASPRKENISQSINAAFINNTEGTFTVDVTNDAVYNSLPGYAVPVIDTSSGNPIVVSYNYVPGPGTLSQFGTTKNNKYQIWTPRPTDTALNNNAQTMWMRNWNQAKDSWDSFGRIYTSNNPPTANDIGAVASSGSAFDNLTIRDYLKIGHVIIRPDEETRSVTFEWVD